MAVLPILVHPDPRLREVAAEVRCFDEELRVFCADLEETLFAGPAAVGIAAPQVGRLQRIVIVDASMRKGVSHHGRLILVNPRIVERDGTVVGREGCLSVPDHTGNVARAERITVAAQDPHGEPLRFEMEGFEARVLLHEMDHLDGLLFIDRVVSRRDIFRRKVYQQGREGKAPS